MQFFVSKGAMDIDGLGDKIASQLIEAGLIEDVADIYSITRDQLLELEGFAEKKADKLLASIEASKSRPPVHCHSWRRCNPVRCAGHR